MKYLCQYVAPATILHWEKHPKSYSIDGKGLTPMTDSKKKVELILGIESSVEYFFVIAFSSVQCFAFFSLLFVIALSSVKCFAFVCLPFCVFL